MLSRAERERVEQLEAGVRDLTLKFAAIEAQRELYERALANADERYDRLQTTHQEALRAFQKVADQYTDGLSRARETISELSATNTQLSQPFRNAPLHKTEEEEDLEFQLDHGVINMSQYNEALRMAGLADD